ncbi:hypothetical protein CONCODRAFT_10164 [Conidiobolus coronatus NRRL 28638]|uniref:Uncharacterized protein n=1 Tax=Conidiobolus coronatus (strain ATCC 28846 / CBS 209.66 / NRRL 28638) TaxID=796925 RepID=A0A137NXW6_CONC2|nr:hypothetical protein CONCODRAFT_10164 [Conidiobolus coronatus NRRL 28638]|eukprot:KXN67713.1 hypothetical protein CONCODRAFT_10164 [Conidiobolus coronatus NRRL 28638]
MLKLFNRFVNLISSNGKILKYSYVRRLSGSNIKAKETNIKDSVKEININSEQPKKIKSSSEDEKIPGLFLEILKNHIKQNKHTGYISAIEQYRNETGIEIPTNTLRSAIETLGEELGPDYDSLYSHITKDADSRSRNKLKDSHLKCLESYLGEDKYIKPTQVRNKLRSETGLDVSYNTINRALVTLRKEMGAEFTNLDLSTHKLRQFKEKSKLGISHLECLKKYLQTDQDIGPTKAIRLLHEETGLLASIPVVRRALIIMKGQIGVNDNSLFIKDRESNISCKLKNLHLECLKRYLLEDRYISPTLANKKLCEETGLEVSTPTISDALTKLRVGLGSEFSNLDLIKVKNRRTMEKSKIKDSHLECLKKYLKEDIFIGTTQAMDQLHKETGLSIGRVAISNVLKNLREEIALDSHSIDQHNLKYLERKRFYKLKSGHLDYLKKYLEEDKYIGDTAALKKLRNDTDIEISLSTVRSALKMLREDMGYEYDKLNNISSKSRQYNVTIKSRDLYLDYLRKYLKEDKYIRVAEAKQKLLEEGLEVSNSFIYTNLKKLRDQLGPEYSDLDSSVVKSRRYDDASKIKDLHLDLLENYLSENEFTTGAELEINFIKKLA